MKTVGMFATLLLAAILAGCGSTGAARSTDDGAHYNVIVGQGGETELQFLPDATAPAAHQRSTEAQNSGGSDADSDWNPGADYLKKPGRHYGMNAN